MGRYDDLKDLASSLFHTRPLDEERLKAVIGDVYAPIDYIEFLKEIGFGDIANSFALYEGLIEPSEMYPPEISDKLDGILCFGDNFGGDCFAFDTRNGWRIVQIDHIYGDLFEWGDQFESFITSLTEGFWNQRQQFG